MTVRLMHADDAEAIAAIYNEGIRGRGATLRPDEVTAGDVASWVDQIERHPVVGVVRDDEVLGGARAGKYSDFPPYAGVGELAIYVRTDARGTGVGRELVEGLAAAARESGHWKLTAKVFPGNQASLGLLTGCGWREVGLHLRHGRLDGAWLDVVLLELSL